MSDFVVSSFDVSRETSERLRLFVGLLLKWNKRINLIGKTTENEIWVRHIQDCIQLFRFNSKREASWLDMGSGAGLPGLILAILYKELTDRPVMTVVESDGRKCAFLTAVSHEIGLNVEIINSRVEDIDAKYDIVTARAFSDLTTLIKHSVPLMRTDGVCVFPKGKNYVSEIADAKKQWRFNETVYPSLIDPESVILVIKDIESYHS